MNKMIPVFILLFLFCDFILQSNDSYLLLMLKHGTGIIAGHNPDENDIAGNPLYGR